MPIQLNVSGVPEIIAGTDGTSVYFQCLDDDGNLRLDAEITSLKYYIYDITNGQVVRAETAVTNEASGSILLSVSDTELIGDGPIEKRRFCLIANDTEAVAALRFNVVQGDCL